MTDQSKDTQTLSLDARLARLDDVESKIMLVMQHAGNSLDELAKDKPVVKQVENHAHQFRLVLKEVESEMNAHINYLNQISAGLPYERSNYSESVSLYHAIDRLHLVKEKLSSV